MTPPARPTREFRSTVEESRIRPFEFRHRLPLRAPGKRGRRGVAKYFHVLTSG
jgi:hypothetical protein